MLVAGVLMRESTSIKICLYLCKPKAGTLGEVSIGFGSVTGHARDSEITKRDAKHQAVILIKRQRHVTACTGVANHKTIRMGDKNSRALGGNPVAEALPAQ